MASPLNRPVSVANLLLIVATVFLVVLLWQLQSLLVTLMIAVVLAAAIAPIIDAAEKLRCPRWLAVIAVYLVLFSGLIGTILIIGPSLATQIQTLISALPFYLENLWELAENLALR